MRCKRLSLGWRAALLAIFTVTGFVTSLHGATEKVLFNFNPVRDGYSPIGGLIFDATGNLYGTTSGEVGINCIGVGCGTVFELTPKAGGGWTEKVLHSFNNNLKDGLGPSASLILDAAGNLYGTTSQGGAHGLGTVFEVMPKAEGGWTEKILLTFNFKNGYLPNASLVFDSSGNLYGTTAWGGAYNRGTVFELTPKAGGGWTEKVLHSFNNNGTDGYLPNSGLIFDAAGNLYGTTSGEGCVSGSGLGCGTVFELSRKAGGNWTEKVLHAFNGKDGYSPNASLIFDAAGNLYGTTTYGGAYGEGTVFQLTPKISGSWTEKVLHAFNGKDGSGPNASLVFDAAGNLYGTTTYGGAYSGGTVFELTRNAGGGWRERVLHSFKGNTKDGYWPNSSLIFDAVGNLYGTTQTDGVYGGGTVFEITP